MLEYLRRLVYTPILGLPLWWLLFALGFIWLVDWLSGGRLRH